MRGEQACLGSIPEGEQKAHKYICFGERALCKGNYDLYALVKTNYNAKHNFDHIEWEGILTKVKL